MSTLEWIRAAAADPQWQSAQADYISDHPGKTAVEKLFIRSDAAHRMFAIESRYSEEVQS